MATSTIEFTQSRGTKLSALSLRRLRQAHEQRWLVRIVLNSCHYADGWPESVDVRNSVCLIHNPELVHPRVEYRFAEMCDVILHTASLVISGRRIACLALPARWFSSDISAYRISGDLISGSVEVGQEVTVLLSHGERRLGTVISNHGARVLLDLRSASTAGPPIGWHAQA